MPKKKPTPRKDPRNFVHVSSNKYKIVDSSGQDRWFYYLTDCDICGEPYYQTASWYEKCKPALCSRKCVNRYRRKRNGTDFNPKNNPKWFNKDRTYVEMPKHPSNRGGWVVEHRIVVEKELGRYLVSGETVHHINMIKKDNDIENLFLCKSRKEHSLAHGSINKCVAELLEAGCLVFDKKEKKYFVNSKVVGIFKTKAEKAAKKEIRELIEAQVKKVAEDAAYKDRVLAEKAAYKDKALIEAAALEAARIEERRQTHSGVPGVKRKSPKDKWSVSIRDNYFPHSRSVHIGYFADKTEAVVARWKAEVKYKHRFVDSSAAHNYIERVLPWYF